MRVASIHPSMKMDYKVGQSQKGHHFLNCPLTNYGSKHTHSTKATTGCRISTSGLRPWEKHFTTLNHKYAWHNNWTKQQTYLHLCERGAKGRGVPSSARSLRYLSSLVKVTMPLVPDPSYSHSRLECGVDLLSDPRSSSPPTITILKLYSYSYRILIR